ncbi:MAG: HAMP domain-containing histidine kinase, partial [Comamonadaceae bacterium]
VRTAAQIHGLMRAKDGVSIEQLVAEFRALRSSVLRLWGDAHAPGPGAFEDIARFNEAIDQAVTESVAFYARERERWRQIFLGIVGHDLRSPLNAISLTAEMIRAGGAVPVAHTALLSRGVNRMTALLDSLLEYSRSSLGPGMVLQKVPVDLAAVCQEELELLRAGHRGATIEFTATGDAWGNFDASRVREALANLVSNAVKHGHATDPVTVAIEADDVDDVDGGDGGVIRLSVENTGEIGAHEFEMLFEPLRQRDTPSASGERSHLGLGLFIVRQIARAHGGDVQGSCVDHRVRFTIELPKAASTRDPSQ